MNPRNIGALVNILGFITGAALYAMLLMMVLRAGEPQGGDQRRKTGHRRLLLATALLGLLWNLGALMIYGAQDWDLGAPSPWFTAAIFTALGFLPAVVVNSVLPLDDGRGRRAAGYFFTLPAYGLSALAGAFHFLAAGQGRPSPSPGALQALMLGFGVLTLGIVLYTRRTPLWKRAFVVVALAVFAVSALHISLHAGNDYHWFVELIGHHSSLPLVIAMLYQDYRFALADIFLKRALALIVLVALAFGLYVFLVAPLLRVRDARGDLDPLAVGALLGLWLGTALSYPYLRKSVIWFVDRVVLRRENYHDLREQLARLAAETENTEEILDRVSKRLERALTAYGVRWMERDEEEKERDLILPGELVRAGGHEADEDAGRSAALVVIPTNEPPRYVLRIGLMAGGRELLSDDIAFLESIALMLARRIDAVRVTRERWEMILRQEEIGKLATEAELKALRAQLNPHFLFNALTTISYLIKASPERAHETLMRLTGLLRAVLREPTGEFATLGEEIDLIESYLAIERARFEERLMVEIDVPSEIRQIHLPPLVIQPLVENAIKHGIAPLRSGGLVRVEASRDGDGLRVRVSDTGRGMTVSNEERRAGVGLTNIEQRLARYYGRDASLDFASVPGSGTTVTLRIPINNGYEVARGHSR